MKISKLIKNEIEEERATHENPMALDDHDVGFVCGMIRCEKIALAHEAEYGWMLISTAPNDERTHLFRHGNDDPFTGRRIYKDRPFFEDDAGNERDATEWYKYEEETK